MANRRGNWSALWSRLALDSRLDLAGMRQARVRRAVEARMRARGLETYAQYLDLLAARPGEFAALLSLLRSDLFRAAPAQALLWRAPARLWVEALPVAAVLAEAVPATGGLRLLAWNRQAEQLLGEPTVALAAQSREHRWYFPNLEPCSDDDLPLYRAIWQGAPAREQALFLCGPAGHLQPLAASARRVAGRGVARAILTLHPLQAWQAEETGDALLARCNEAQALAGHYRELFSQSPAALLVTAADGTIEEANGAASALLGRPQGLAGLALAGLLAEEAQAAWQEALGEAVERGEAAVRLRPRFLQGRVLAAQARRLGTSGEARLAWALHDVTEQVEGERQRGDLTDLVLHDLRSPLATALLGLDAAQSALPAGGAARATRALAMARAALRRLSRLVDSLLDISRLEAGHLGLECEEVRAAELLAEVAAEAELAIASHDLHLELYTAPDLPVVVADRDMVYRAVCNLLDNAIRFSPPGGQIQVRAAGEGGGLAISVADEGPGIPPDLLPRIFDKFVGLQLPHAPRGYGLGLAFCKLAAEAHGGAVTAESTPGHGSTFTLWLPAGRPQGAPAADARC